MWEGKRNSAFNIYLLRLEKQKLKLESFSFIIHTSKRSKDLLILKQLRSFPDILVGL